MAVVNLLCVAWLFASLTFFEASGTEILVTTTAGEVRGLRQELNGTLYRVFAGIPYAEPPVGPLRFSPPVAKTSWRGTGTFNATSFGPSCPQDIASLAAFSADYPVQIPEGATEISEDCLTLNVYTPYPDNSTAESGWAVMVWIHGGSFRNGQGSGNDAAALAVKGKLVVVTVNYRLGPFGFLFTSDENALGNFGLMDQQLALRWVQGNIQAFGGDPSRVTLSGQADVHGSATLHMFAKESRRLFHRVAALGGTMQLADLQESESAIAVTKSFAKLANCPYRYSDTLVECLREKTMDELLAYNLALSKEEKSYYAWGPVFTRDFFVLQPGNSLEYDLLTVFNSGDGSIALALIKCLYPDLNITKGITAEQLQQWLDVYINSPGVIDEAVKYKYIDDNINDKNIARMKALVSLYRDWRFSRYGAKNLRDLQPLTSSTHLMVFDHRSSAASKYPTGLGLAPHGSELPYVFGLPFSGNLEARFTDEERALSYRMLKYWSNFAKTGDPNESEMREGSSNVNISFWPEYGESEKYLRMELQQAQVGEEYLGDEVYFWNKYLRELSAAADDYCPAQPQPNTEVDCEEPVIGEGLGLALDRQQAETLIQAFMYTIIVVVCVLIILIGALLGYRDRRKTIFEAEKRRNEAERGAVNVKKVKFGGVNGGPRQTKDDVKDTSAPSTPEEVRHAYENEVNPLPLKTFQTDDTPPYARVIPQAHRVTVEHSPPPLEDEVDPEDYPPPPEDLQHEVPHKEDEVDEDLDDVPPPPPDDLEDYNPSNGHPGSEDFVVPSVDDSDTKSPAESSGADPETEPASEPEDDSSPASDHEVAPPDEESLESDPASEPADDGSPAPEADHSPPDDFHSLNQSQSSQLYDRIMNAIPQ